MKQISNENMIIAFITIIDIIILCIFLLVVSDTKSSREVRSELTNSEEDHYLLDPDLRKYNPEDEVIDASMQVVEIREDYQRTFDESLGAIYIDAIVGEYHVTDSMIYSFGADGSYRGFFDANNRYVEGYHYSIYIVEDDPIVVISNSDKTLKIQYQLSLQGNNVVLCFEPTNTQIELKK